MEKLMFYIDSMQMGGANRVMANLTSYFSKIGVKVVLVNDIRTKPEKKEYEIETKVKRVFLDDKIDNENNKIIKNLKRIQRLRRVMQDEKPDAVISFMGPPNERMVVATLGLKVKTIVSVRSDPYMEYGRGIRRVVANILFSIANGCVFQTDEAARYFRRRIVKKSRIIFNPINPKFYQVEHKKENGHIIVVGRLQHMKNPELILNAFAKIEKKYPWCELDFFGTGDLEKSLVEKVKRYGLVGRVNFKGLAMNIEEELARASVFVLCSDYEGMPNALMEAMAVGLPVISTDCPCGGPRMLILNPDQGLLVPCNDIESMVRALEKVLENKELRQKMSVESRKRARQFHPDIVYKEWEMYIESLNTEG